MRYNQKIDSIESQVVIINPLNTTNTDEFEWDLNDYAQQ